MGGLSSYTFHSLTSQNGVRSVLCSSLEVTCEGSDLHNMPYNSIHLSLEQMCYFPPCHAPAHFRV